MKKFGLILFVGCLIATTFTGNQCRKKIKATPLDTTVVVPVTKDTNGEDIHVSVYQYQITSGSKPTTVTDLYLINNFQDYTSYVGNKNALTSTYIVHAQTDQLGTYTFPKVKPSSINPSHDCKGPGGGLYEYHIIAVWPRGVGDTLRGEYQGGGAAGAPVPVNINNGLNNAGLAIPIAVN